LAGGPATERKRGVEWKCDNCTLVNHDTDIECRACGHAPWKQQLVSLRLPASGTALAQKQSKTVTGAGGEGPAGKNRPNFVFVFVLGAEKNDGLWRFCGHFCFLPNLSRICM